MERAEHAGGPSGPDVDDHLPNLPGGDPRMDADGCLPVSLHMRALRCHAASPPGRLLRVLFLRHRPVPADTGGATLMSLKRARIAAPVGGVVAAGASVVCMASMGAMGAAATAT